MFKFSKLIPLLPAGLFCLIIALPLQAEEEPAQLFELHCMKTRQADYESVEKEIWQPIQQELVNSGDKVWWGIFAVVYGDRSKCDYYSVDVYTADQLKNGHDFDAALAKAHPGNDFEQYWQRTYNSRENVETTLWRRVATTDMADFNVVTLNWMKAPVGKEDDYVKLEGEYFKPVFQKMVQDGSLGGWSLSALVSPAGSSVPYNYMTADFWKSQSPPPFMEAVKIVHPKLNADKLFRMAEEVRTVFATQTLYLVTSTTAAKKL